MDASAIVMMIIGILIIWGGFVLSVAHAAKGGRK